MKIGWQQTNLLQKLSGLLFWPTLYVVSEGGACMCSSKGAPIRAMAQWHNGQSEPASKFIAHRAVVPAIAWLLYLT